MPREFRGGGEGGLIVARAPIGRKRRGFHREIFCRLLKITSLLKSTLVTSPRWPDDARKLPVFDHQEYAAPIRAIAQRSPTSCFSVASVAVARCEPLYSTTRMRPSFNNAESPGRIYRTTFAAKTSEAVGPCFEPMPSRPCSARDRRRNRTLRR